MKTFGMFMLVWFTLSVVVSLIFAQMMKDRLGDGS